MKLVVCGTDAQWNYLTSLNETVEWVRVDDAIKLNNENADAYFYLYDYENTTPITIEIQPVFINSMHNTLHLLALPNNFIRINAWPTFFEQPIWEVAGVTDSNVHTILKNIHKKIITVNDEPGFISARVVAMIINEAYFAKGDHVSSADDIDTAMKLGTNYPYGPFEWCQLIGAKNIVALLQTLSIQDVKYTPAPALINEI